jgi:hypothetical protein
MRNPRSSRATRCKLASTRCNSTKHSTRVPPSGQQPPECKHSTGAACACRRAQTHAQQGPFAPRLPVQHAQGVPAPTDRLQAWLPGRLRAAGVICLATGLNTPRHTREPRGAIPRLRHHNHCFSTRLNRHPTHARTLATHATAHATAAEQRRAATRDTPRTRRVQGGQPWPTGPLRPSWMWTSGPT